MRLTGAAVLGLLVPGSGHLVTGRRRDAAVFFVPLAALVALILLALAQGGLFGLVAFAVTPGVLPALAVLNVILALWRIVAGVDAARVADASRRSVGVVAIAAAVLVVIPHVLVGRAIASTSDLLDSMFASGPAPSEEPAASQHPAGGGLITAWPFPTDDELIPGWSPDPTVESLLPSPSPSPRRLGTGGGNSSTPLPALGAAVPWTAPGAVPWGSDGRFDLLLMGSDAGSDRWSRRMDVMLLVEVDVATGETAMVGLPRNLSNAPFPPGPARDAVACGCLTGLLNEAYEEATARHPERWPGTGVVKGIGAVRSIVSELVGRPIDAVVVADLMGVVRIVDAMGGVDINVPSSVYDESYPDPVLGDIVLSIKAGPQHFSGRLALAYARSRHQDSDYGRMARQQTLLLAIRSQLGPATILQAPDLVTAAKGAAWTDLPRESLPSLVTLFGRAASARVNQLRIVPPTYPEWLTTAEIAQIRRDVAGLLSAVPTPTASPSSSPSLTPGPSSYASPSPVNSPSQSPAASSSQPPSPSPSPTPKPS